MKKVPFALVLALGLVSGSAFAASSGTVTIEGQVLSQTCAIAVGDENKRVTLPTVSALDLTVTGARVAPQNFTISLSDCDVLGNVYARFSAETGALIDPATGTLINTAKVLPATNVNVALYGSDASIPMNLANPTAGVSNARPVIAEGSTILTYSAAYYPTAASAVTAGAVSAKANYIIAYQ